MISRNEGSLVALSSCAGLFGLPNLVPYCGTKFAVRGYMAALVEELRQQNPKSNVSREVVYHTVWLLEQPEIGRDLA